MAVVSEVVEFERVAVASRVFTLAAILGLAALFDNPFAVGTTLIIAGIAAVASYVTYATPAPVHWVIAVEAGLTGALVVTMLPESVVLLPYLVLLPLLGGLVRGLVGAASVIVSQLVVVIPLAAAYRGLNSLSEIAELLAPWVLTIAGAGLLGAWAKKLGKSPTTSERDESYESARRLLGQLRTLSRRLTTGLDPVTVSTQILERAIRHVRASGSAVFIRTDSGVFVPLAEGARARDALDPNDPLIGRCWETRSVQQRSANSEVGAVVVLPLLLGSERVGALLLSSDFTPRPEVLEGLLQDIEGLVLPLATALVFEDVRTLVTTDERQRLAREIHDGIAQEVASLGYVVDDLAAESTDAHLTSGLKSLRDELSRVVSELRLSIFDLRTDVADSAGLGSALSDYVRKIGSRSSITVHLTLDEAPIRLSRGVETELFRIAQEAITNARKHSQARNLWVDCWVRPPFARIQVRDDGKGLGQGRSDSYGMRIMRERAEQIDAAVTVSPANPSDSSPGTCVNITIGDPVESKVNRIGAAS